MANPIIGRPDAFTSNSGGPQRGYTGYGQPDGYAQPQPQFDPRQFQQPAQDEYINQQPYGGPRPGGVMTLDDVLAKTAMTLGAVAIVAVAIFMLLPPQLLWPAVVGSAVAGLILVMVVARRSPISPAGVMAYAAIQGVFVGAFSKTFEFMYPGIVVQAVVATFFTAAATLAAYKFFNIRVTARFKKMVFIGTAAIAAMYLVNFVLVLFGVNTPIWQTGSGAGWISILVSIVAVTLAVLNLVTDFDSIETGIARQAPANESWRAALGVTVTMVWLYVEILRILSYFRD